MSKVALVTGVSGQDGSYLAEFLLAKGYAVHGIVQFTRRELCHPSITRHYGDLFDGTNLDRIIEEVQPNEFYHLGAQSDVRLSFDMPVHTAQVTGVGTLRVLESIRQYEQRGGDTVRFYQASSSEMFGQVAETPQRETTPFHPRSPYGCAKVYAYWQTINYRESYGLFACNGILFNHESPRRGEQFVTRKITRAATRIKLGLQDRLQLGNLSACRDWGFAGDYVEAMWRMLQHEQPDDYVVATGESHSVRDFLDAAFGYLDLDWQKYVDFAEEHLRPAEVPALCGDSSKARSVLGWEPHVGFVELAQMMVDHDLELAKRERHLADID